MDEPLPLEFGLSVVVLYGGDIQGDGDFRVAWTEESSPIELYLVHTTLRASILLSPMTSQVADAEHCIVSTPPSL